MKKVIPDLIGLTFGKLRVSKRHGTSKSKKALWKCECECGGFTIVTTQDLKSGHTKSCGCLSVEATKSRSLKHGLSTNNLFFAWNSMKERCFNPNNKSYANYGGRGIRVCEEWKEDFQTFYNYVSQLPHFGEEGYSLDRINNDGNYEPGNVKWSTHKEQCGNRRNNIRVEINGETHTLAEWSEISGVNYGTLYYRYMNNKQLF